MKLQFLQEVVPLPENENKKEALKKSVTHYRRGTLKVPKGCGRICRTVQHRPPGTCRWHIRLCKAPVLPPSFRLWLYWHLHLRHWPVRQSLERMALHTAPFPGQRHTHGRSELPGYFPGPTCGKTECSAMCFLVTQAHSELSSVRSRPWRASQKNRAGLSFDRLYYFHT